MRTIYLLLVVQGAQCGENSEQVKWFVLDDAFEMEFNTAASDHLLTITAQEEPGASLQLIVQFVDKETSKPLKDQRVRFYHTDTNGQYMPSDPTDESTARLSGEANTDEQGRIFLQTILPGDYGSSVNNRHIHTTVYGAHPEAYDMHFRQFSGQMGRRFISRSDQHFLVDLSKGEDGYSGRVRIEVKNPKPLE